MSNNDGLLHYFSFHKRCRVTVKGLKIILCFIIFSLYDHRWWSTLCLAVDKRWLKNVTDSWAQWASNNFHHILDQGSSLWYRWIGHSTSLPSTRSWRLSPSQENRRHVKRNYSTHKSIISILYFLLSAIDVHANNSAEEEVKI